MAKINVAIIGIGNCASSLLQGITFYHKTRKPKEIIGLMNWNLGGYKPHDIKVVAAFDIDKRKVGKDVSEAIFALPNCTTVFCKNVPKSGVTVRMGKILDGLSEHMKNYEDRFTFVLSNKKEPSQKDVINVLKRSKADMLLNYLPVGSEKATKFYTQCALEAGIGFINNIPVFIASSPQ